jgi:hypothetical protein
MREGCHVEMRGSVATHSKQKATVVVPHNPVVRSERAKFFFVAGELRTRGGLIIVVVELAIDLRCVKHGLQNPANPDDGSICKFYLGGAPHKWTCCGGAGVIPV